MAVTITVDDIKKAETYLDIEKKTLMAELMTSLCIERIEPEAKGAGGTPMPPLWRENRMKKQQFLMGVLATQYLKKTVELQKIQYVGGDGEMKTRPVAMFMGSGCLNEWAGSHVMNQLERLKKKHGGEIADRIFDLLYDYRNFETMLNGAIRDALSEKNDPANRLMQAISLAGSREAVDAMRAGLAEGMQEIRDGLKEKTPGEESHD